MKYWVLFVVLVFLLPSRGADTKTILLAARWAKRIEIVNPDNLATLGSVVLDRAADGISAGTDHGKLFIELMGGDMGPGGLFELNLETHTLTRIEGMRPMYPPNGTR